MTTASVKAPARRLVARDRIRAVETLSTRRTEVERRPREPEQRRGGRHRIRKVHDRMAPEALIARRELALVALGRVVVVAVGPNVVKRRHPVEGVDQAAIEITAATTAAMARNVTMHSPHPEPSFEPLSLTSSPGRGWRAAVAGQAGERLGQARHACVGKGAAG